MRRTLLLAAALAALVSLASCSKEEPPKPKRPGFRFAPAASASARAKPACTFGADQTCNDDSLLSSVTGTCNEDGTCTCRPGFVINRETGRCKQ